METSGRWVWTKVGSRGARKVKVDDLVINEQSSEEGASVGRSLMVLDDKFSVDKEKRRWWVAIKSRFDSANTWESSEWVTGDGWKAFMKRVGKDLNLKFTSIPRKHRGVIWRELQEEAWRYWKDLGPSESTNNVDETED